MCHLQGMDQQRILLFNVEDLLRFALAGLMTVEFALFVSLLLCKYLCLVFFELLSLFLLVAGSLSLFLFLCYFVQFSSNLRFYSLTFYNQISFTDLRNNRNSCACLSISI